MPTKAISSVSQLTDTPSNRNSEPSTKLTVAMPVHTRGTPGLHVDAVAEHGEQQQRDAERAGRQHGQAVAAEHQRARAHHAGDADARR